MFPYFGSPFKGVGNGSETNHEVDPWSSRGTIATALAAIRGTSWRSMNIPITIFICISLEPGFRIIHSTPAGSGYKTFYRKLANKSHLLRAEVCLKNGCTSKMLIVN